MIVFIIPEIELLNLTEHRGLVEESYRNQILSDDIIETVVDNWMDSMAWRGFPTEDILAEGEILTITLGNMSRINFKHKGEW